MKSLDTHSEFTVGLTGELWLYFQNNACNSELCLFFFYSFSLVQNIIFMCSKIKCKVTKEAALWLLWFASILNWGLPFFLPSYVCSSKISNWEGHEQGPELIQVCHLFPEQPVCTDLRQLMPTQSKRKTQSWSVSVRERAEYAVSRPCLFSCVLNLGFDVSGKTWRCLCSLTFDHSNFPNSKGCSLKPSISICCSSFTFEIKQAQYKFHVPPTFFIPLGKLVLIQLKHLIGTRRTVLGDVFTFPIMWYFSARYIRLCWKTCFILHAGRYECHWV